MTRDEHLMTVGAEECVEVALACLALAQRIQKAQRFGMQQVQQDADDQPQQNPERLTNFERIRREYVDLVASMEMLGISLSMVFDDEIAAKREKVERYLQRSVRCGTLDPAGATPSDQGAAESAQSLSSSSVPSLLVRLETLRDAWVNEADICFGRRNMAETPTARLRHATEGETYRACADQLSALLRITSASVSTRPPTGKG